MNSSNNLKSGQKTLFVQVLILVVVIVLVALIGLLMQKSSSGGSAFADYKRSSKLFGDINTVHANLYRIKGMVASGQDKQDIAKLSDQQAVILAEDINIVKKALDSNLSDEQKKFYQAIMDNLVEYQKSALQVIKLAPMNTGAAYQSSANDKMDALTQLFNQLLDFESGSSDKGGSNSLFYIFLIALILLLVLSIILIPSFIKKMLTGSVIEPLQETSGVLREYATGKYSRTLTWEADDAIGELVESVNTLRSKMSSTAAAVSKSGAPEPAPAAAQKTPAQEPAAAPVEDKTKSLSDMIKKAPEQAKDADKLVMSSRKAIDKLQDI